MYVCLSICIMYLFCKYIFVCIYVSVLIVMYMETNNNEIGFSKNGNTFLKV